MMPVTSRRWPRCRAIATRSASRAPGISLNVYGFVITGLIFRQPAFQHDAMATAGADLGHRASFRPGTRSSTTRTSTFRLNRTAFTATTRCSNWPISSRSSSWRRSRFSTGHGHVAGTGQSFPSFAKIFGGRQAARSIHFVMMLGYVGFIVVHVTLVALTGFMRNMNHIVLGTDDCARWA